MYIWSLQLLKLKRTLSLSPNFIFQNLKKIKLNKKTLCEKNLKTRKNKNTHTHEYEEEEEETNEFVIEPDLNLCIYKKKI